VGGVLDTIRRSFVGAIISTETPAKPEGGAPSTRAGAAEPEPPQEPAASTAAPEVIVDIPSDAYAVAMAIPESAEESAEDTSPTEGDDNASLTA